MRIKEIKSFVKLPYVAPSGRLVTLPGFDDETGVFASFDPETLSEVPEKPTRAELVRALQIAWHPWSLYRFASDDDRAAMLAAIFTALSRGGMRTAPGFIADAPTQGSGKTKCMSALGALIQGRFPSVMPWNPGNNAETELEKKVTALLIAGTDFIAFDNVTGVMSSPTLSTLLTDGELTNRILGGSTMFSGAARMFVAASSNNASLDRDLSRRMVRLRIDPGVERPNALDFDFDPVELALSERMAIAHALLVLMSGYLAAGSPRHGKGAAGFVDWNRVVRQPVLWIAAEGLGEEAGIGSIGDPAASIVQQAGEDDPETTALTYLLRGCRLIFKGVDFTAKQLYDTWRFGSGSHDHDLGMLCEALQFMTKCQRAEDANSITVGRCLKYRRDRIAGALVLKTPGADRTKTTLWRVEAAGRSA